MANDKLSPHEEQFIKDRETQIGLLLEAIESVKKFKAGDYLIAFTPASRWNGRKQITNSYGAPKKFIVVDVDKYGIPYMKELNKKGLPHGHLISSLKVDRNYMVSINEYDFEIDPDYTDSLIMMDEENYDASMTHRVKGDLFKAITKHNKSIKVKTSDAQTLINFLQNLKVGDVIWKSIKTNLTVIELQPIPLTHRGTRLAEHTVFGKVKDSKGKEHELDSMFFRWGAFYTAQPRSYNELKDPKL